MWLLDLSGRHVERESSPLLRRLKSVQTQSTRIQRCPRNSCRWEVNRPTARWPRAPKLAPESRRRREARGHLLSQPKQFEVVRRPARTGFPFLGYAGRIPADVTPMTPGTQFHAAN